MEKVKYGVQIASIRFMCNWCPTSLYVSMPVLWCLFQTLVMSKLTVMLRTLQLDLLDFSIYFDSSVQFLFSWHFAVRSPPRNIDWLDTSASTGCGKKSNLFVGPISPIRPPTKKRHQNHHKSKEREGLHGLNHQNRQNTYWPRYC